MLHFAFRRMGLPSRNVGARVVRAAVALFVLSSCKSDTLDPGGAVASVVVTPSRLSVGVGASASLTVEVRDAGGNALTGRKVVWASKDVTVATVSGSGVVSGVSPGTVQVAATAEGKSAIVDVTVNPKAVATIRLTPSGDQQLLVGQTQQISAQPLDADGNPLPGRSVTWSSSSAAIASVSATGLITAVATGGAVITAASEGKTAVVAVTVSSVPIASITVTPTTDTVVVSQTLQLTATAKDALGAVLTGRAIAWSSSDASKATVSSTGLVTGVSQGAVTITASSEGKTGTSSITVNPKPVGAVILSPSQVSVEVGSTKQLTAQVTDDQGNVLTGRPISFSSSNAAVATVSSGGLITAVAIGTATITATSEGKTGTADVTVIPVPVASVEVAPTTADLTVGQTAQFVAVAKDAKGNVLTGRAIAWSSGAPSVATVSSAGVVTAVGAGSAVIFATIEGKIGSATVTVRQIAVTSVTVTPALNNIAVSASVQLTATVRSGNTILTDRVVGWSSSNDAVAVVSSTGRVTGLKAGGVTITATSEGVSGTALVYVGVASIVVTPNPTSVAVGQTRQLTAVARDASNATISGVTFQWSSGSTQTATVDVNGLVTGRATGTVSITAAAGSVSGSSSVTVTPAPVASVTVTPSAPTVTAGQTVQLTATLKDAQGNVLTGRTVTWQSSDLTRATVSSSGLVTTLLTGKGKTVVITATSEGVSGTSTVTIQ
jgi:uncharacterized protein YjdB